MTGCRPTNVVGLWGYMWPCLPFPPAEVRPLTGACVGPIIMVGHVTRRWRPGSVSAKLCTSVCTWCGERLGGFGGQCSYWIYVSVCAYPPSVIRQWKIHSNWKSTEAFPCVSGSIVLVYVIRLRLSWFGHGTLSASGDFFLASPAYFKYLRVVCELHNRQWKVGLSQLVFSQSRSHGTMLSQEIALK